MNKIVLGYGPTSSPIMFVGEAPGRVESETGIPFTGPSGDLQRFYLRMFGLDPEQFYYTNVCKDYIDGNPDPTYEQILEWTPLLLSEIEEIRPSLVVAVGRFAADFFLPGCGALDLIHGVCHRPTQSEIPSHIRDHALVIPIFHPAGGLYNYERKSFLRYDYEQVSNTYTNLLNNKYTHIREDNHKGKETYYDVSGHELESILANPYYTPLFLKSLLDIDDDSIFPTGVVGIDTEGIPGAEWSIQVSLLPGSGYLLRCSQPDFDYGIQALSKYLHTHKPTIALHDASTPKCACYDVVMCRRLGLELQGLPWFNTMYNAFLPRLEPQSLKTMSDRWFNAEMEDYTSLVGGLARDKQLSYLQLIAEMDLPRPEPIYSKENDGIISRRQPQSLSSTALKIISDVLSGKITSKGPTDPYDRYKSIDNPEQIELVESLLGPIPEPSLADLPLDKASYYACRDSDMTLRHAIRFAKTNPPRIAELQREGMIILPYIERMQANGMPVSRDYFKSLHSEMESIVDTIGRRISLRYWDGEPFNPNSSDQVASLCRRRGIAKSKSTPSGKFSTSQDAIEQYAYKDEAIWDVFEWRRAAHNRDVYCNDVLARIPKTHKEDLYTIHSNINMCKVHTRRPASTNPNILAIPARTEVGKKVRHGYKAPPGKLWCSFDLSGVEMRCTAHVSGDPTLCKVFLDHIHPHKFTAMNQFGLSSISEVTDTQKAVGKENNFLINYGGGYKKLYEKLRKAGITAFDLDRCKKFVDNWYATYPKVGEYKEKVIRECKEIEIVYDYWGMARYLPGINEKDDEIKSKEGREAVSHKIQGLAQGMIRNSMAYAFPILDDLVLAGELCQDYFRLLLHDELIFLVDIGQEEILTIIVMDALTEHHGVEGFIIPVEAEAHYGYDWGELK